MYCPSCGSIRHLPPQVTFHPLPLSQDDSRNNFPFRSLAPLYSRRSPPLASAMHVVTSWWVPSSFCSGPVPVPEPFSSTYSTPRFCFATPGNSFLNHRAKRRYYQEEVYIHRLANSIQLSVNLRNNHHNPISCFPEFPIAKNQLPASTGPSSIRNEPSLTSAAIQATRCLAKKSETSRVTVSTIHRISSLVMLKAGEIIRWSPSRPSADPLPE